MGAPVPPVIGHPDLAAHIASEVIQKDFDLTSSTRSTSISGLTVADDLHVRQGRRLAVVGHPLPSNVAASGARRARAASRSARRSARRSRAIRRPECAGLGHGRHEPPVAGPARGPSTANGQWVPGPADRGRSAGLSKMPNIDYVRRPAASIELVMADRARRADARRGGPKPGGARFYHVPASKYGGRASHRENA